MSKSPRLPSRYPHRCVGLMLAAAACCLSAACDDAVTTWQAEARSPDGHWLATARTRSGGGPGTVYDATTVYLSQTSEEPTAVLGFSHQSATMKLTMRWLTPTHFDVMYGPSDRPGDSVDIDLQTVKFGNVEITLHRLPTTSVQ